MKTILKTVLVAFFIIAVNSCDAKENKAATAKAITSAKVEVYYFHFTRRCLTCNAVEAETKTSLEGLYSDRMKAGTLTFKSVNLDEADGKAMGEKLDVSGQSLLIVGNGKQVDLTGPAFMNARSNPEKLKAELKGTIDSLVR